MANEIEGFVHLRYSTMIPLRFYLKKDGEKIRQKNQKGRKRHHRCTDRYSEERLCNYLTTFEIMNDSSLFVFESFKQSEESSNILD